ncbi:MAG: 2-amino-4-hydroxy-6-hydroxymethyldihydropteridine diphosphokinase [Methylococcaceae bacterium]|nr:2-amino-4-hydroxy-6-hydroxymethyldihydropteridine diphosphokinase [Methylococcaceae bacterium]
MPTGYISIGSNIDQDLHIPNSLKALQQHFGKLTLSSVYESAAVGFEGDPFYNLIVGFESDLTAKAVAQIFRDIELAHGRTRNSQKFSARTLDLDLILYGDLVLSDGRLQIPRDEIEHYAFVLEPLAEIAPRLKHPIKHLDYATLWQAFDKTNLQQQRITPNWPLTV